MGTMCLAALGLLLSLSHSQVLSDDPLFSAADMPRKIGRTAETPSVWNVRDGILATPGNPIGYLQSAKSYLYFVLQFEFRHVPVAQANVPNKAAANGGVLLFIRNPGQVWPDAIQVSLAQRDPGHAFRVGDVRFVSNLRADERAKAVKPIGEWNQIEIRSTEQRLQVFLNGIEVCVGEGQKVAGPIGLMAKGTPMEFRKITLK